jgi:hypothetical protein
VNAPVRQLTSAVGWRFWLVRPGQDLLLSPYDYGPAWLAAEMTAMCSTNTMHCPPVSDCDCGIYAERTKADACERARRHQRTVEVNLRWGDQHGVPRPVLPSYVVGRVALTEAMPYVPRAGMIRVGADELRGRSAEIVELCVQPGESDPQVGERLAARYGVPVRLASPGC